MTYFSSKKVGKKTTIRINPENPNQIDDSYYRYLGVFLGSFMIIMFIVCLKGYANRKKEFAEYEKRRKNII